MAILTWKETVLNHIKNLVIRMGDCYMVIYFDNKETLTIDPNNKIKGLGYLNNNKTNKIDVSNDDEDNDEEELEENQEEYDESDDEEELFK
jgi:hypothetical protein